MMPKILSFIQLVQQTSVFSHIALKPVVYGAARQTMNTTDTVATAGYNTADYLVV